MHNYERQLEINEARRERANDRYLERIKASMSQIGELCRNGKTVYYVFPVGGRYREGDRAELMHYLIRNRYA